MNPDLITVKLLLEIDRAGVEAYYERHPDLAEFDHRDPIATIVRECIAALEWEGIASPPKEAETHAT